MTQGWQNNNGKINLSRELKKNLAEIVMNYYNYFPFPFPFFLVKT